MPQQTQVGTHRTTISTYDGFTNVFYHSTNVVSFNHKMIILRTGGYRTVTTKTRMNQASNQFDLGYRVYQRKGDWFVDFEGKTIEFKESTMDLVR